MYHPRRVLGSRPASSRRVLGPGLHLIAGFSSPQAVPPHRIPRSSGCATPKVPGSRFVPPGGSPVLGLFHPAGSPVFGLLHPAGSPSPGLFHPAGSRVPGSGPAPPCKVPGVPEVPAPPRAPRRAACPLGGANSAACAAPARKPPAPRRPPRTRPDSPRRRRHRALEPGGSADRARGRGGPRQGACGLRPPRYDAGPGRAGRCGARMAGAGGWRGDGDVARPALPAAPLLAARGRGEGRDLVKARPSRLKGPACTPSRPAHPAAVRARRAAFLAGGRRSKRLPAPSRSANPRDFTGIAFQLLNYNSGVSRGCGDDAPGKATHGALRDACRCSATRWASPRRSALGERSADHSQWQTGLVTSV